MSSPPAGNTNPNAPITNLDDFFGGGITLAQYERTDEPMVQQKQAQAMNVDLIDMNTFLSDPPEPQDGQNDDQNMLSTEFTQSSPRDQRDDFLGDEEVALRDHSDTSGVVFPV